MRLPKVHIAIVGVNRSLSLTHESIEKQLLAPLQRLSFLLKVSLSLTLVIPPGGYVENERTGESGFLEDSLPEHWKEFPLTIIRMEEMDQSRLNLLANVQMSWTKSYSSDTLRNLSTFLYALSTTYEKNLRHKSPDVVIFARPDIKILGRLRIVSLVAASLVLSFCYGSAVLIPNWHSFRGFNDRFAVVSKGAIPEYFNRVTQLSSIPKDFAGLNSEKILAFSLRDCSVFPLVDTPMVRMRINGILEPRDILVSKNTPSNRPFTSLRRLLVGLMKGPVNLGI